MNIVDVIDLIKKYDDFSLKNVNFSIPKGEITGFIGKNGHGKTTTIKCLLNLIQYESGEILFNGKDSIKNEKEFKDKIGVVFDELPFDNSLNAKEISKVLSYIYTEWSHTTFIEYLNKFELSYKKKISKFSKGMKTKLSLAVALSHKAQLLILDEPTSGLDPIIRIEILDELKEFVKNSNNAVFFSTHIINDLEKIADNILLIYKGKIVFHKKISEIYENYLLINDDIKKTKFVNQEDIVSYRQIDSTIEMLVRFNEKYVRELNTEQPSIDKIMCLLCRG